MKNIFRFISILLIAGMPVSAIHAQDKLSIDLAAMRNMHSELNGLNISSFYHFNERLSAGIEMNRFFPITRIIGEERTELSAWDFDLNFHYLCPLYKKLKWYPIAGLSHTSEKETIETGNLLYRATEKFYSANAGAGILLEWGHWAPHVEYLFTWGKLNQQFLLAGMSYEISWGKEQKKKGKE